MTLNNLMTELALLKIAVKTKGDGQLSISAPKGALTDALKLELQRFKKEMVALLEKGPGAIAEQVQFAENASERYEPFPFSDLQMAFSIAEDPFMEFNVRPHYYCETDFPALDIERYHVALNKAMLRHRGEIVLRSGEQGLTALREVAPVVCAIVDLRAVAPEEAEATLLAMRERMMREQLPLDRWPWFDFRISRRIEDGAEICRIHTNHNTFYTDGFGAMVLQEDINHFYANPSVELAPLTLTYRDAVLGLQNLAESPTGSRAKQYWRSRLAELPEPPPLPLVAGMDRRRRSLLQRRENILTKDEWSGFKTNAARAGLTPTSAIVAAYAEIMSAWSGAQHFILSNMVTRRLPLHPDIGKLVGSFASLYPLEVDLRGELPFYQRAARLQTRILTDSDHREWGGMQVMQALNRLKGELGSVPCPYVVGSGLFAEGYTRPDFSCLETPQTMLDHQFWELDDGRYCYVWDVLEQYFPAGLIDQMWQAYDRVLRRLANDYSAWEATVFDVAPAPAPVATACMAADVTPRLLHASLADNAGAAPDDVLLATSAGCTSYAQAQRAASTIALRLAAAGVGRGELVAVMLDRSAALVAATFGILEAGAAYVPIDPALPLERIVYMLNDSKARVVLTSEAGRALLGGTVDATLLVVDDPAQQADAAAAAAPAPMAVAAGDLAYVIYTSGSTGKPKGVMIEHSAVMNTIDDINRRFGVTAQDRLFGVSSFSFDLSVYDLFGAVAAGAAVVYPDPDGALNPAHWIELMAAQRVTVWNSAPPLMSLLVESALRQQVSFPDLRLVMLSGDWIPLELPDAVRRIAPNARIVSLGGATEASIWSIFYEIGELGKHWSSIPYGFALAGQDWQIRDSVGRATPVWTPGELYIGGHGLARGYWGDEEKTKRGFIVDAGSGRRLYRTGDIGRRLPDGSIEFLGRVDSQVKIQGHRIELGEIESTLGAQPQVRDAVVLARAAASGSGAGEHRQPSRSKTLVAYITLADETAGAAKAHDGVIDILKQALQRKLPGYMVPSNWLVLAALPITPNGKVDRAALTRLEIAADRAAEQPRLPVAPRTELEHGLAVLWRAVLACDEVGVHDDFFTSGGQSFDAVRLLARIKEKFGTSLKLSDIWADRTIEKLALRLQSAEPAAKETHLVAVNLGPHGSPYFFVHPGGGQILCYYDLAARLDRPTYAFTTLGDDVEHERLASVEDMAARYLVELLKIQGAGPYRIGGWSSGGGIAFELARQLELRGEQVAQVLVMDCPSPAALGRISRADMVRNFFEDLDVQFPMQLLEALDPADLFNEPRLTQVIERFNTTSATLLDAAHLVPVLRTFAAIVDAARAYRAPGPIAADVLLLRAAHGRVTEFADHPQALDRDWGWAAMTRGQVRCREIDASHYTFLKAPAVAQVAQAIVEAG